ncbi:MAG: CHASE2 domain-containing protein, partial [Gemmatimonadaceae bacterium]|nr:CHASE2 domain-containing protein [Gloeobacterales cyanobacterium ES-bin-141]
LAVRKFLGRSVLPIYEQDRIHFFGPERTFTEYGIEDVCPPDPLEGCGNLKDPSILERFTGKIVLVGIVDGYQDTPEESTPAGKMDALDLHANIIAGLLSGTVDRQLSLWIDGLVTVLVGVAGGWALNTRRAAWASGGVVLVYAAVVLLALSSPHSPLILPVIPPLAAFACTALTLGGLAFTRQTRQRLKAQEEELNRLRRAEREAILNQAKKLLYRVATDIHDRPLQELKLVMDQLEQLLFELPEQASKAQIDKRLDQALVSLQNVGRSIRVELNDLRQVAAKLEITPALKNGLHAGLHSELNRLVENGELHLNIERAIKPLLEPSADSQWLDEREDLFRFFKEALNNAIRHGQARGGTRLRVELAQTGALARLVVENDGPATQLPTGEQPATVLTPEGAPDDHARGGYGTKVMNTIAGELLAGKWERVFMPDGGVRVVLLWQMSTGSPSS